MTAEIPAPGDLRKIREDLGLSQSELAAALGFTKNGERTVRAWESAEIRPSPLAWAALRYLVGLYYAVDSNPDAITKSGRPLRALLPEVLR